MPFSFRVALNIMGHSFKKGWRIRLALSPSFYPTLWELAGSGDHHAVDTGESRRLRGERAHPAGARAAGRRQEGRAAAAGEVGRRYVNPDDYLPTLAEARPAETTRKAYPETINGKPGMLTRKVFDSGRYQYGGPLQGLWVDQVAEENFEMVIGEPLSLEGFTSSTTIFERRRHGFRARSETTTRCLERGERHGRLRVPLPRDGQGLYRRPEGQINPSKKTVDGEIPRSWI